MFFIKLLLLLLFLANSRANATDRKDFEDSPQRPVREIASCGNVDRILSVPASMPSHGFRRSRQCPLAQE